VHIDYNVGDHGRAQGNGSTDEYEYDYDYEYEIWILDFRDMFGIAWEGQLGLPA
jgi:hypothetical protein